MVILEDSRQQLGKHNNIAEYCEAHGIAKIRSKIVCGDYCSPPTVSVDTKQGMAEVYQDIVQDHERFRNECVLAQSIGTKLIILVENDDGIACMDDIEHWKNPRVDAWYSKYAYALAAKRNGKKISIPSPPIANKRLIRMMETMSERYGVVWMFCAYEDTGKVIMELLG